MPRYAALLRGIMPMNPNMRNEKLRGVFESLGLKNVQTIISSGNVIFESSSKAISALELKIEKALLKQLGIKSPAYIRSKEQLESMIASDPFKGVEHNRATYLIVSFLKQPPHEIFSTIDLSSAKTPEFMRDIEKKYGKDVTTRTWKTIERIVRKMNG
ncbi:MAG: hypothetical protein JWO73_256 [Candidatus Taylorbacteria bacterium]|nr:hypothetical protein [Candidatus Taylorbacteria bacterium]